MTTSAKSSALQGEPNATSPRGGMGVSAGIVIGRALVWPAPLRMDCSNLSGQGLVHRVDPQSLNA